MVVGANCDNCRHGMGLTVNPCILDILGAKPYLLSHIQKYEIAGIA